MLIKQIQKLDDNSIVILSGQKEYVLTEAMIEQALIENNQMCPSCLDSGELNVEESVDSTQGLTAPVGKRECHCTHNDYN